MPDKTSKTLQTLRSLLLIGLLWSAHSSPSHADSVKDFFAAQEALHKGQPIRALKLLRRASKKHAHWGLFHLELTRALLMAHAPLEQIESALDRALAMNPKNFRVYDLAGQYRERKGDHDAALALYLKAKRLGFLMPMLCVRIARVYLIKKQPDKGLPCLQKFLSYRQHLEHVAPLLARIHTQSGRLQKAESAWTIAISHNSKNHLLLSTALQFYTHSLSRQLPPQLPRWQAQIQWLRTRLQTLPRTFTHRPFDLSLLPPPTPHSLPPSLPPQELHLRGFVSLLRELAWAPPSWRIASQAIQAGHDALKNGALEQAIKAFSKATQAWPRWGFAHLELARAKQLAGENPERLTPLLQTALKLSPQNPAIQEFAGLLCENLGAHQKALAHYRQALKDNAPPARACLRATALWNARKTPTLALPCLKKLFLQNRQRPEAALALARILSTQPQPQQAQHYWQQVLFYFPRSARLHQEALDFYQRHLPHSPTPAQKKWRRQRDTLRKKLQQLLPKQPTRRLRPLLPSRGGRLLRPRK